MPRRTLRHGLLTMSLACLALTAPGVASAAGCANADLMPASANASQLRGATLCLVNKERTRRGRRAVTSNPQLRASAQRFSEAMVRENFFAHVSPGGSTLLSRVRGGTAYLAGAGNFALGENIGWGCGDLATPRQTVRNWMASPPHRINMLNPRYRQVGVGVAIGAPLDDHGLAAATYTTDFGQRSPR